MTQKRFLTFVSQIVTLIVSDFGEEKNARIIYRLHRVASDVLVWTYEGANLAAGDSFELSAIGNVDTDPTTKQATVYFDDDNTVVAILINVDDENGSSDDIYAVINEVNATVNADNDKVHQLVGYGNGVELDKLTKNNTLATLANGVVASGQPQIKLYKVELNDAGEVAKINTVNLVYQVNGTSKVAVTSDEGIEISDAGKGYVVASASGITLAIADNAKIYEASFDGTDLDEYSVISRVKKGDFVFLAETDDDEDGYDVVIVIRP